MLATIARDTAYSFLSSIVLKITIFILTIFIARELGANEFGKYGIAISTSNMILIFASMGLGVTSIKFITSSLDNHQNLSKNTSVIEFLSVITSILLCLLTIIFSTQIATVFFKDVTLVDIIVMSAFLMLTNSLIGIRTSMLQAISKFNIVFYTNLAASLLLLFGIGSLIILGLESVKNFLYLMITIQVIDYLSKSIIYYRWYLSHGNNIIRFDCSDLIPILKFSIPSMLNGICFMPVFWYTKTLLVQSSGDLTNLGLFDAAYQWLTIVMIATGAISTVALPSMIKYKRKNQFKKVYSIFLTLSITIPLVISLVAPFFGSHIENLYGDSFSGLSEMVNICLYISIFYSAWSIMSKVSTIEGKQWTVFSCNVVWSVIMLLITPYLIDMYNAKGLLLSILFSWVFVFVLYTIHNIIYFKRVEFYEI
ncbi:oligosaccharide flippase family protein [Vibrio crassostreae]|uniref:oligosaccharide flippase family protein n=1 Tax=Vibrio crassostreae TaxID=246167 RepID=UPI0006362145|nr:oligosaccharide flippase family protein [Vibrio crassostreae]TCO01556.1 O-antigen/teichoic acid export membrane protein [Vibrio crassostreae]TCT51326.1 O-antigen/teichoic acid export membrane protein [Vibrio crassostreae]TCT70263.1 O-antigen/teichoic acid export membrane protein [Vibrio crassostreae]TCT76155.1 O-antigen/teichoic acid export membrane protein [Vibrio crassostreae]TCT95345.1 O-antigen/teichoic acid export membrane protein [Vibrio crassostreae]